MEATIVVAIIAAAASLVVAVIAQVGNRRTQLKFAELNGEFEAQRQAGAAALERLKLDVANQLERQRLELASRLEEERAGRSARREYEYRALLRLYQECEPLIFEAVELAERARGRVRSLARSARDADLMTDGSGWLSNPGYYFRSTVFFLLAPSTTFKILQRRLTAIDLSLSPGLQLNYELLKIGFYSFTEDFTLAGRPVELPYDPDRADPHWRDHRALRRTQPAVYGRQGLYLGTIDILVEALVTESKDVPRCKSFGEFVADWDDEKSTLHSMIEDLTELVGGFHPLTKPVLWRVLVFQALLYDVFLQAQRSGRYEKAHLDRFANRAEQLAMTALDWRTEGSDIPEEASSGPIAAAADLLRERLDQVSERLGSQAWRPL